MNITLVHYSAPPIVGGVETVIGHQARLMADGNHQVQVIAGRGEQVDIRVPFLHLPLADSRHTEVLAVKAELDRGQVSARFHELVSKIEIALNPLISETDTLIVHNVCSLHKNLALTAALHNLYRGTRRHRLILWHHDLAWTTPRYRAELHEGYPWDLLRQAWPGARQVTVSEMRQQELSELFQIKKEEIAVIPNGVDIAKFHKLEELTTTYLKQLNLLDASPLLLLPVRITSRKNIELALHTLTFLRKDFPNAKIVITGPLGPHNPANLKYFEKLVALRKELNLLHAVWFLAELSDQYIPDVVISDFYHLADALFLPSREEGFGIPLLEAGLTGIPVFCSNIPPLQKLGEAYVTYFSPDADPQNVADAIRSCLKSSQTFALRNAVRANYTWEHVYSEKIVPLLNLQ